MRIPTIATLSLLTVALVPARARALDQDAAVAPPPAVADVAPSEEHDARQFSGLGLHMHMEIGPAYGQQALQVERLDALTLATGDTTTSEAIAGGPGAATRLELWPVYGRHGGIGVYGDAVAGGLRRQGGGTAMFSGAGGLTLMVGHPRLKLMLAAGRARRASAYGTGTESVSDVRQLSTTNLSAATIDPNDHYTAGSSDVRSHRAGIGVRAGFDSMDRRGLDVWLLFDEPTQGGPVFGIPSFGDSAMAVRSTLWLRNVLALTGEVTVRSAELQEPVSGNAIRERTALITLGWSLDRFSRPY